MAQLRCAHCGTPYLTTALIWSCERCGGHLNPEDLPLLRRADIASERTSLWRYQKASIHQGPVLVSLGEGWTPLVRGQWKDTAVLWKCEFVSISGSFKDRGASVMINRLLANGVGKVAEDSSGNGGAAVATYAAAAELPCRIYIPAHTSPSKVTQIAATGAEVIRISGTRQAVAEAAIAETSGFFYASHNWDPGFVDGLKTLGFELWEQCGFQAPDAIVAPVGGGSNLLGCFRAFSDLRLAGEIGQIPRLYGAQSESCQPLAIGFATGADMYVDVESAPTIAEGVAVSRPVRSREVLSAVRESSGGIYAVSEQEIATAHDRLARSGLYVEPTSAVAAALLDRLLKKGDLGSDENIVVILTGSGLKAGELITSIREGFR
jgi:threonine synthase